MGKVYAVYILTNKSNKVLYIGVTNDLKRRMFEHKNKLVKGFTNKYNLTKLAYFCVFEQINDAILYEKRVKGWLRKRKIDLIESTNPQWNDLSDRL